MDMVINEDDIKLIIQKKLENEGYTVANIVLGLDPKLTDLSQGTSKLLSGGVFGAGHLFDSNNPNRPKIAIFANVNK